MFIYKGIYIYINIYYMYTFQFSSWLTTARSDKQEQEKLRKQDRICKQDRKKRQLCISCQNFLLEGDEESC